MTISDGPVRTPPGVGPALDAAYAHCARITQAHYENFPVASRLLPKALRPHVCAVYAFARAADDFADEPRFEGERLERLSEWEGLLDAGFEETTDHPVFVALGDTIRRFDLPPALFRDLLTAFRMDVTTKRHATFEDLIAYSRYSANPVGRIVLRLFGLPDPGLAERSDAVCTALQLANFWQDVAIDLRKDRIYLPVEDLNRFGVTEEDLRAGRWSPAFADLLRLQIARTRDLFRRGLPLVKDLLLPPGERGTGGEGSRRLSFELRLTWLGGVRILDRIEANGCDVFHRRPKLGKWDWVSLLWKAWGFKPPEM